MMQNLDKALDKFITKERARTLFAMRFCFSSCVTDWFVGRPVCSLAVPVAVAHFLACALLWRMWIVAMAARRRVHNDLTSTPVLNHLDHILGAFSVPGVKPLVEPVTDVLWKGNEMESLRCTFLSCPALDGNVLPDGNLQGSS